MAEEEEVKLKNLLFYLEQESISIIRDSFTKANNPVMLYSIGKDSSVMLHLARKAFYPLNIPFPLLHIDTKWKFKEMIKFKTTLLLNTLISLAFFIFAYRNINISYFRPLNQWMVSENKYREISEHLFEEDVVFSLSNESWPIPSFGPKIISCIHAQAFINDSEIREKDTDLFFTETLLSDSVRWDIIKKYKINKILVPLDFQPDIKLNHWLSKNTTLIFKDKKYLLSKITLHNTFSNKK